MSCPPLLALSNPNRKEHADFWWRLDRPFARLREAGMVADVCWLGDDEMPTISPDGRVVVLQRTSFVTVDPGTGTISTSRDQVRAWIARLRAAGALAVIADMDDDTVSPAYLRWLNASGGLDLVKRERLVTEQEAWRHVVASVDAMTVSTEPLAEVVRRYTDAPVHVVPNAIDVDWFRERLAPRPEWADLLTIGWAGGRRPDADLEPMAVAWGRIARRYPDVRFVVAGWQPDVIYREVEDIDRIIRVPWQALETYPTAYQVDIGCCPLADTPFNRCKSPIKAWEYALAGAVVIASPTVYGPFIDHRDEGCRGFLATSADDWEREIAYFIDDASERTTINGWAVEAVEEFHPLADSLSDWVCAYSEIATGMGVPA